VAVAPAETELELGDAEIEKSEGFPKPVSTSDCIVGNALSVNVSVPVTGPVLVGVKVTLTAHDWPVTTGPLQVLVCVKLPLAVTFEKDNGAFPLFTNVMDDAALDVPTLWVAKSSLGVEKLIVGTLFHSERVCVVTPAGLAAPSCTRSELPSPFTSPALAKPLG
jgi:hypothetical protein